MRPRFSIVPTFCSRQQTVGAQDILLLRRATKIILAANVKVTVSGLVSIAPTHLPMLVAQVATSWL